jgi:hypothetical protein
MYPDLKPGKHLVLDNTNIADTYRLRRRVHQPVRDPQEPVLRPEKPSDGTSVTPLHVVFDKERKMWRMWYQAHDPKLQEERVKLGKSKYGNVGEPQPIYCCYSESPDGIHWNRPNLGIYGDTNVVFKGFSYVAGNTFILPGTIGSPRRKERDPTGPNVIPPPHVGGYSDQYIMVNCEWVSDMKGGIYIAHSPDGLRWKYPNDEPHVFGESDTWNCMVWNPERQVFMLYMRGWHCAAVNWPALGKGNPRRRVNYSESKDLKMWTEPQQIVTPDELDTNDYYGLQVFRYADYWLGQLWIYDDDVEETIEIELIWSREGIQWSRLPERQKFLRRGRPGDQDGYMVIPAQEPVVVGNEMFVYYTGHPQPHGAADANVSSTGYRGRLRRDGFISLDAGLPHGALISRPFTLQSDRIEINAAAHHGEIVAELVEPYYHEPEGKPIEGFTAKDFDVFKGDSLAHKLSWRGTSDLSSLKGRRVMLRMLLQRAELYSFTI